jgi:predicted nucleic acid-binding protein
MADYLVDSNVLLRRIQPASPHYPAARRALRHLYENGNTLYVTSQNLLEFWSVATRSAARGGLALTTAQAARHLRRIRQVFRFLPDIPDVYLEWETLAVTVGVRDSHVYDARLVAVMRVYGLTHILTFNTADFQPFTGIIIVDPQTI